MKWNDITFMSGILNVYFGLNNVNEVASLIFTVLGIITSLIGFIPMVYALYKSWKNKSLEDGKITSDEIFGVLEDLNNLTQEQISKIKDEINKFKGGV